MLQQDHAFSSASNGAPSVKAVLCNPYLDRDGKWAVLSVGLRCLCRPDRPILRQLEDATVVLLGDILPALRTLDLVPVKAKQGFLEVPQRPRR